MASITITGQAETLEMTEKQTNNKISRLYENIAYFKIWLITKKGIHVDTGYLNLSPDNNTVIISNKIIYYSYSYAGMFIPYKSILSFLLLWVYRKVSKYVYENLGSKNFPPYKETYLDLTK